MKELDPDVHWYPGLASLVGGLATVYRGHQGVRDYFGDLHDTLDEVRSEFPEIRDLDSRIVAIGHFRARDMVSRAETESPLAYVIEFKNGKATKINTYLDGVQALEAAGLSGRRCRRRRSRSSAAFYGVRSARLRRGCAVQGRGP